MGSFITSVLAFVVAISVLVAVHEFGHFWVARRLGIKVLRFSIGFGSPIWRKVAGQDQVEYVIASIPLGGYVKLLDEREGPVPEKDRARAFNRQPVSYRVAVLVAGPAFNFLFAILAYWLMFSLGVPGLRPVLGAIEPASYAAEAGLNQDDEIIRVGEEGVQTWEHALLAVLEEMLGDGEIPLTVKDSAGVQRSLLIDVRGQESRLTEPGQLLSGLGIERWRPFIPAVIGEVVSGEAGDKAGLLTGDNIVAVDGVRIEDWTHWAELVAGRPGELIALDIVREGSRLQLNVFLGETERDGERIGRVGAGPEIPPGLYEHMRTEQRFGPVAALKAGAQKTWDMSLLTLRMLWKMVTGEVSIKNISGPINIAEYAGYTASAGLVAFLSFLAIVSISLGILNLLPVPMLDGGQVVYQLAELAKGSPVSERTQIIGQQIGIVLLIVLMSFAFYNDLSRLMG